MRTFASAVLVACALAAPGAAQFFASGDDAHVGVDGAWWTPELDSEIQISDDIKGTSLSLEDDLGVDDEDIPWGSLWFQFSPKNKLTFSYFTVGYEGDVPLTKNITFEDKTYNLNTRVESNLDLDVYEMEYLHMFGDPGMVRFGFLVGVKVFDVYAAIAGTEATTGVYEKAEEDVMFPLPQVGAVVKFVFGDIFTVTAKGSGIGVASDQVFYDASALIGVETKYVGVMGGYRIINLDVEADDDAVNLEMSGPAAVVSLRF